VVLHKNAV
jgi:hypothetical protein